MAMIDDLRDEIKNRNIIFLLGTGVSIQVTGKNPIASWKGLLTSGIEWCFNERLHETLNEEWKNKSILEINTGWLPHILNAATIVESFLKTKPNLFEQWIYKTIGQLKISNDSLIKTLMKIDKPLVTTNYDGLIEKITGLQYITWRDKNRILPVLKGDIKAIFHLHGHYQDPESIIMGHESYAKLLGDYDAQNKQEYLAAENTIISLGCGEGLDDPNFKRLLDWIMKFYRNSPYMHYSFVCEKEFQKFQDSLRDKNIKVKAYGNQYEDLEPFLIELFLKPQQPIPAVIIPDPSPSTLRPTKISPLPELDRSQFDQAFIGREKFLTTFTNAILSMLSENNVPLQTKLMWVHGYGGMGKSWFLRRAYIEAIQHFSKINIGLIDWDDPDWRKPLNYAPVKPKELLEVIAERLAQLYGIDSLDEYWKIAGAVRESADIHLNLLNEFDRALRILKEYGKNWREHNFTIFDEDDQKALSIQLFILESLLKKHQIWNENQIMLVNEIDKLKKNSLKHSHIFEQWATDMPGIGNDKTITNPAQIIADALQNVIKQLCKRAPLLLIFDTCELLSEELDWWLRYLIVNLLKGDTKLLVLIGNRLQPDCFVELGSRDGWRNSLGHLINGELFDENVLFSTSEIEELLRRFNVENSLSYSLSTILQVITNGVPLALRVILDMHQDGSDVLSSLANFPISDREIENKYDIRQKVIESVSDRFLYHLQNKPELIDDFMDIIAIGLLRNPSLEILSRYWDKENPKERLLYLTKKYSILSQGDLHQTVRQFVRLKWRGNSPPGLKEIAKRLRTCLIKPDKYNDEMFDYLIEDINLLSWISLDLTLKSSLKLLIILLVYRPEKIALENEIINEMQPGNNEEIDLRNQVINILMSHHYNNCDLYANEIPILDNHVIDDWNLLECACYNLLKGLYFSNRKEYKEALDAFEKALPIFGSDLPKCKEVSSHYLSAVRELYGNGKISANYLEKVYQWAQLVKNKFGFDLGMYGLLLKWLNKYDEGLEVFNKAMKIDVYLNHAHWHQLAHIYEGKGMMRDAKKAFVNALKLEPTFAAYWVCFGKYFMQVEKFNYAISCFKRAISIDKNSFENKFALLQLLVLLPDHTDDFNSVLNEIIELNDDDSNKLNSVAWFLYQNSIKLADAENYSKRSIKKEPDNLYYFHTLAMIFKKRGKNKDALNVINRILELENPDSPILSMQNDIWPMLSGDKLFISEVIELLRKQQKKLSWEPLLSELEKKLEAV